MALQSTLCQATTWVHQPSPPPFSCMMLQLALRDACCARLSLRVRASVQLLPVPVSQQQCPPRPVTHTITRRCRGSRPTLVPRFTLTVDQAVVVRHLALSARRPDAHWRAPRGRAPPKCPPNARNHDCHTGFAIPSIYLHVGATHVPVNSRTRVRPFH